jgi:hypothetical protein
MCGNTLGDLHLETESIILPHCLKPIECLGTYRHCQAENVYKGQCLCKPFGTRIKCPVHSAKDPQIKWPPLLRMFLATILVGIWFTQHHTAHWQSTFGNKALIIWKNFGTKLF